MVHSRLLIQTKHQIEVAQNDNWRQDVRKPAKLQAYDLCHNMDSRTRNHEIVCLNALAHLFVFNHTIHDVDEPDHKHEGTQKIDSLAPVLVIALPDFWVLDLEEHILFEKVCDHLSFNLILIMLISLLLHPPYNV